MITALQVLYFLSCIVVIFCNALKNCISLLGFISVTYCPIDLHENACRHQPRKQPSNCIDIK